jgi:hypothetical protein
VPALPKRLDIAKIKQPIPLWTQNNQRLINREVPVDELALIPDNPIEALKKVLKTLRTDPVVAVWRAIALLK